MDDTLRNSHVLSTYIHSAYSPPQARPGGGGAQQPSRHSGSRINTKDEGGKEEQKHSDLPRDGSESSVRRKRAEWPPSRQIEGHTEARSGRAVGEGLRCGSESRRLDGPRDEYHCS